MDKFVSRGGIKLQVALDQFQTDVKEKTVLDVGSSTGGFVDCLLQNGAAKVYSIDTAYGELAWKLRNDPRVVVMERTNILHLEKLPSNVIASTSMSLRAERSNLSVNSAKQSQTEEIAASQTPRNDEVRVDMVTIDAGWTKLELVLPVVKKFLKPGGIIIALLKPHYQADKSLLRKGVLPAEIAEQVKGQVVGRLQVLGYRVEEIMDSPILGGGGNREYLLKIIVDI